jgi:hypothetical protein
MPTAQRRRRLRGLYVVERDDRAHVAPEVGAARGDTLGDSRDGLLLVHIADLFPMRARHAVLQETKFCWRESSYTGSDNPHLESPGTYERNPYKV